MVSYQILGVKPVCSFIQWDFRPLCLFCYEIRVQPLLERSMTAVAGKNLR